MKNYALEYEDLPEHVKKAIIEKVLFNLNNEYYEVGHSGSGVWVDQIYLDDDDLLNLGCIRLVK